MRCEMDIDVMSSLGLCISNPDGYKNCNTRRISFEKLEHGFKVAPHVSFDELTNIRLLLDVDTECLITIKDLSFDRASRETREGA